MNDIPSWMEDAYGYLLTAVLKAYASGDEELGDRISNCTREVFDIIQLLRTKEEN